MDGWMDKENVYSYIYTVEYYSALKRKSIIWDKMNEPGKHYAKWIKPDNYCNGIPHKSQTHRIWQWFPGDVGGRNKRLVKR